MTNSEKANSRVRLFSGIVVTGIVLATVGIVLPFVATDENLLDETQAREYVDAAVALHASTDSHDHGHGGGHDQTGHEDAEHDHRSHSHQGHDHQLSPREAAEQRMNAAVSQVERARFLRDKAPRLLWGLGAFLVVVGGLGLRSQASTG